MVDISYFKTKFTQLKFRVFENDEQMQSFLERTFKNEDTINSLVNNRLSELENKIQFLTNLDYYKEEQDYIIKLYNTLKTIKINSLNQLEDVSKKIDILTDQFKSTYEKASIKTQKKRDIPILQQTISFFEKDKNARLNEEEAKNIEKIKMELNVMETTDDFIVDDVEKITNYLNIISNRLFTEQQTNPKNFVNGEPFKFLVHNLTSYTDINQDSELYRKKFISASFITENEMELYGHNKVGFIYSAENNVVASDSKDLQSYNTDDNSSLDFIGRFSSPTVKPPLQIEEECVNKTIEKSGEKLRQSEDSRTYSEVVLDISQKKPIGIFCITNGEKEFNFDYVNAVRLANEFGLPLVNIDKSLYRSKNGLAPIIEEDKIELTANMLYFYYEELGLVPDQITRMEMAKQHYNQVADQLLLLKANGLYSKDSMREVLNSILDYSLVDNTSKTR